MKWKIFLFNCRCFLSLSLFLRLCLTHALTHTYAHTLTLSPSLTHTLSISLSVNECCCEKRMDGLLKVRNSELKVNFRLLSFFTTNNRERGRGKCLTEKQMKNMGFTCGEYLFPYTIKTVSVIQFFLLFSMLMNNDKNFQGAILNKIHRDNLLFEKSSLTLLSKLMNKTLLKCVQINISSRLWNINLNWFM